MCVCVGGGGGGGEYHGLSFYVGSLRSIPHHTNVRLNLNFQISAKRHFEKMA